MQQPELKRELSLLDAVMIVAGSMIGSGIFIVSADICQNLGSPGFLLGLWGITGVITLIGAMSYGELAGMMPKAGGQYVYLQEAYNPLVGFLFGWTTFLVIETGTIAAVAVAFAKYTGVVFPFFSEQNVLIQVGKWHISTTQVLAISLIALLTYINIRGVKEAKTVQLVVTFTKIIALMGLIFLGIGVGWGSTAWKINLSDFWTPIKTTITNTGELMKEPLSGINLWSVMGLALVGPLFSSSAWNNITYTAAEIKNPKRDIPLSLFYGTLLVSILYMLANVAYLALLPVSGTPNGVNAFARGIMFASENRVGTAAAEMIFGTTATLIMAVFIMVSTFGCNNGIILSGARVYYAMAKDGLFFKKAAAVNKQGVPHISLIIQGAWASLLCLSGTYSDLLDYTIFSVLIFYILTIAGVFILRKTRPQIDRPYRAVGYPILPAFFIIIALLLCINLLINKPFTSWAGVFIVLTGIPAFYAYKKY